MARLYFFVFTLFALTIIFSCKAEPTADWKIDVGIKNVGSEMIDEASVKWGEFKFTAGIISASSDKTQVCFDRPIPDTATVHYSLPDGKEVTKTVMVKSAVPAEAFKIREMTVMFEVNSDNADVKINFLHFIEKDGYPQLVPFEPVLPKSL